MAEEDFQQGRDISVQPSQPILGPTLYANSWAVVIGIDAYNDPRVPTLRYAERDAEAVAAQLPSLGFPPENITLLLASRDREQVDISHILRLLHHDLARKMNKEDQFLFYFAGHGVTSRLDDQQRGYLLLPASELRGPWPARDRPYLEDVPWGALETVTLRDTIAGLGPKHKLAILDACFSGLIVQPRSTYGPLELTDRSISAWTNKRVMHILTAGGAGEQALESDSYRHGIFTHFLLHALEDGVRPGNKIIPAYEISSYVKERVSAEGAQNPQSQTMGEGEFLFIRKPMPSKRSQMESLSALVAAAIERGEWDAAETGIREARTLAGDNADLVALVNPLAARVDAARKEACVAEYLADAGRALDAGQLSVAAGKAAEAEKLAANPDQVGAVAAMKVRIVVATAEATSAACLREAEAALTSGSWKSAAAKLAEARKISTNGSGSSQQALAACELKLHEFANALAQRLLGEARSAIVEKKFSVATAKLAEVRALPASDSGLAKSIAETQASLAAAKKASGVDWDRVGPVITGIFMVALAAAVVFFLVKSGVSYIALAVKSEFWSMAFTSCQTWLGSLHWYGWVALIVAGLVLIGSLKDGKGVPAVLFVLWVLMRAWGPTFDQSVLNRLMHKPAPASTAPVFLRQKPAFPTVYSSCLNDPVCANQVLSPTKSQPVPSTTVDPLGRPKLARPLSSSCLNDPACLDQLLRPKGQPAPSPIPKR